MHQPWTVRWSWIRPLPLGRSRLFALRLRSSGPVPNRTHRRMASSALCPHARQCPPGPQTTAKDMLEMAGGTDSFDHFRPLSAVDRTKEVPAKFAGDLVTKHVVVAGHSSDVPSPSPSPGKRRTLSTAWRACDTAER